MGKGGHLCGDEPANLNIKEIILQKANVASQEGKREPREHAALTKLAAQLRTLSSRPCKIEQQTLE